MSPNCQRQFQLSNYCSHDIQLHQQNCPPFFHLPFSCLLGLPLPVCDLLHGQALSSGGRVLLVPHMHSLPSVPAWCHVAAPSYRTQRAQLPVSRMAWLCIFHTQGIAQDCISHGDAAVQGVKCLSWKLCLDSQGWLCWEEGILGVTRHQACRSLSSIYSTVLFGSVSPCVCVWKSCWLQTWAIIWSFEAGEEFPFSILLGALLGVYEPETKCWTEMKSSLLAKIHLPLPWERSTRWLRRDLKTELCGV